ncbi:streptogrisin C [Streptoalloteichus tenebrarius]|uniref:Streptogrisin C n=1 Tax=Streptoalloteichus tenebrarius (strain ATCC 17920 / DSM 40477 / JCM 4838 / CBS 697.72 / NBRC 16177 / NCIMB 11028 / NRRL B-12390 / A12253. 1 / ISP 5477) TaxID=1933 RepID=A0ABT1HYP2_STRSD|nr:S1 family peptidase [Streptoalloteichus tenebrarius]MCP2260611.1 streptogrisin C [Streptoalloteichus tenebrarius]BFF01494.1 alpha-lytic protease prodomain-containing protein [Streptoalloteichus tenebrarius]
MKPMNAARIVGAALLVAGATATFTLPAGAAPDAGNTASPEMLAAMQRDLGLTADQAKERVAKETAAAEAEQSLRGALGAAFGGAHYDAIKQKLVVGVTDLASVERVRAAGAEPTLVGRSEARLNEVKAALDARDASAPQAVTSWYVDPVSNSVVVTVSPGAVEQAKAFAATVDADAIRVVESTESPRPLYDLRGGDAYYIGNSSRCSIGFSVEGGFVTAGHCGKTGASTSGYNRVAQGTFAGSVFPGNDYAWVRTNSNWTPKPLVKGGNGDIVVKGSQEASVNASICRSGSTTGWRCGTLQAKNQTVRYPQGTVNGLTKTSACAEPGDSGGSFISGQQAQGVTSGGSGNCSSGGTTYFQPVNPILGRYSLKLVTG